MEEVIQIWTDMEEVYTDMEEVYTVIGLGQYLPSIILE